MKKRLISAQSRKSPGTFGMVFLQSERRDRIAETILSAPHGHPLRRSGCFPAEPYPADGYWNEYHIPRPQFKRALAIVFSNDRTWIFRFVGPCGAGERAHEFLRRCATAAYRLLLAPQLAQ